MSDEISWQEQQELRRQLSKDVEDFLAKGGKIEKVPTMAYEDAVAEVRDSIERTMVGSKRKYGSTI